jgi:hypothetical protein
MTLTADPGSLIVVAPTFYARHDEIRYLVAIEACRNAAKHQIQMILVDASSNSEIREGLEQAGGGYVQVVRQTALGRKGAALREAIQLAYKQANEQSVIAFQELEKSDMFRHWLPLVQHMNKTGADVTIPRRADNSFRSDYPIEQYHCESFANSLLNSMGADIGLAAIDWTIGPAAFRYNQAHHWINFDGELWDAQLIPLVNAHLAGAMVTSLEIDYRHPKIMKEEEEGVAKWNEKRLMQLNFLKDTVGKLMVDTAKSRNDKVLIVGDDSGSH